jgi:hypothetical protein
MADELDLIGFDAESGWHYHGNFASADPRGSLATRRGVPPEPT